MENELIFVPPEERADIFLKMRELAFAQLNASFILGLDAPMEAKEEFVQNFPYDEIDQNDFETLMPTKVFEQYFEMHKEKEPVDGCEAIRQVGLMEAVNKLIYYGLMKTYSRLHDEGLVDMYCLPDGNITFVPHGHKPKVAPVEKGQQQELTKEQEDSFRLNFVKKKKTKNIKKTKKIVPKKKIKNTKKKSPRRKKKNDDI
jgi:hypothetical protein